MLEAHERNCSARHGWCCQVFAHSGTIGERVRLSEARVHCADGPNRFIVVRFRVLRCRMRSTMLSLP